MRRGVLSGHPPCPGIKKLHGYEINKYLPVFFDTNSSALRLQRGTGRFQKKLVRNDDNQPLQKAKEISNSTGWRLIVKQAPGYPLIRTGWTSKALGALDIPGRVLVTIQGIQGYQWIDSIDICVCKGSCSGSIFIKVCWRGAIYIFQHWMEGLMIELLATVLSVREWTGWFFMDSPYPQG